MDRVFLIYILGSLSPSLSVWYSVVRFCWHDVHVSSIETFTQKLLFDRHKNAQFRFSMHFLFCVCVVFCYDQHNRLGKYHYHTMDTFLFFSVLLLLFLFVFRAGSRARFHLISLYFENFIAECATKLFIFGYDLYFDIGRPFAMSFHSHLC